MQEDESESEPETAETVPPPKNMAIFQEPDTQPRKPKLPAAWMDWMAWTGKFYAPVIPAEIMIPLPPTP